MSSSDLVTLAQMDGKMQWLAGYGNLPSEKTYRLPTKAAIVLHDFAARMVGYADHGRYGNSEHRLRFLLPVISFDNDFALPVCVSIIQKKSIGKITG